LGRVKIADFGLAKLLGINPDSMTLTLTQHVVGTPRYMAPEQIDKPTTVDHRADIYSLGVVIYEMATGRLPFERRSQAETLTAVVHEPHAPIAEVAPGLPAALSAVVDRALAKGPADRYQSMEAMLDELRRVAS
jgi:serine/threonine-protein kinase